jgi:putative Mg2+ transporter-C (MgtC) family protein
MESLTQLFEHWPWEDLLRLCVSVLIGGVLGLDREFHGRAAGLRTHMLVSLGCCVIMLVSTHFVEVYQHLSVDSVVRIDPARLAYGVTTGIGFLGAGVIIKQGLTIHGLTTAASLWTAGALGLSVGLGMYVLTVGGVALAMLSLTTMRRLGDYIPAHHYQTVRVTHKQMNDRELLCKALEANGILVLKTTIDHRRADDVIVTTLRLRFGRETPVRQTYDIVSQAVEFDRIEIE